jgi:toxin YoeB
MWQVVFTKQAQKDAKKLSAAGLRTKAEQLIEILRENPYMTPPPFEKLLGDLSGAFSRRINIQHRLVYQVFDSEKIVKVISPTTIFDQFLCCTKQISLLYFSEKNREKGGRLCCRNAEYKKILTKFRNLILNVMT